MNLRRQYPHPLNGEIFSCSPNSHPDCFQLLNELSSILPSECRVSWPAYPGCQEFQISQLLIHEGISFGAVFGTRIYLRLPSHADVKRGHTDAGKLSKDWVNVAWLDKVKQRRLIVLAYEYASDLARKFPVNKVIIRCPNCAQKLRAPNDRGRLNMTCPKCRHQWLWSPIS